MKTSRHKVLDYIRTQRIVTTRDINRAMQMTEANARHHLAILESQGLVNVIGQYRLGGKGRPANLYGLTEESTAHNLHRLADAVLFEWLDSITDDAKGSALRSLAKRMIQQASLDDLTPAAGVNEQDRLKRATLTNRLYRAIHILNKMNYVSRWEAHTHAPRVIIEHCPYAEILDLHPEMCEFDKYLLEQMLDIGVEQFAKLVAGQRGNRICVFLVQPRAR